MDEISLYERQAKAMANLLDALSNNYGLQVAQNWEILLMIAGRLHNLADDITNSVMEAKARDEKERNDG